MKLKILKEDTASDAKLLTALEKLISGIEKLDVSMDYLSSAITGEDAYAAQHKQSYSGRVAKPRRRIAQQAMPDWMRQQQQQQQPAMKEETLKEEDESLPAFEEETVQKDASPVPRSAQAKLIQSLGFGNIKFLGSGMMGKVYKATWDAEDGVERAIKVVKPEHAVKELNNYRVISNARKKDELIAKHFADVEFTGIDPKSKRGVIVMELLENDPNAQSVIEDIFGGLEIGMPSGEPLKSALYPENPKHDISKRTEALIASRNSREKLLRWITSMLHVYGELNFFPTAKVTEKMMTINFQHMLSVNKDWSNDASRVRDKVMKTLGHGSTSFKIDDGMDIIYRDFKNSPMVINFINRWVIQVYVEIMEHLEEWARGTSPDTEKEYRAYEQMFDAVGRALKDFTGTVRTWTPVGVTPSSSDSRLQGAPAGTEGGGYPGAKSILQALERLYKITGLVPKDMHDGNVMARSGTKDLVIVDVGLFKREQNRDKVSAREEADDTIQLEEVQPSWMSEGKKKKYDKKTKKYRVCTASIAKTAGTSKRSEWNKGDKARYDSCLDKVEENSEESAELVEAERIDKEKMPCNKPRRTPSHAKKSHVVKACSKGKKKIIRFGEQGAKTAGKPKKGESKKMKKKRKSFKARHGKNIKKGKMSAAYWANKVKWEEAQENDESILESILDDMELTESNRNHPTPGRSKKYFGNSLYGVGGGGSAGESAEGGDGGGGDGNRDDDAPKKDACYKKIKASVKAKGGTWPSAYASGRLVQCRDKGADNWKEGESKKEGFEREIELDIEYLQEVEKMLAEEDKETLHKWFKRKGEKGKKGGWVDCNAPDGDGGYKECAQGDRKKYPACRPSAAACKKDKGSKGKSWGKKSKSRSKK